jgi:hypothetical protein
VDNDACSVRAAVFRAGAVVHAKWRYISSASRLIREIRAGDTVWRQGRNQYLATTGAWLNCQFNPARTMSSVR